MKNTNLLRKVLIVILFMAIVLMSSDVQAAVSFSVNKTSVSLEKGKTTTFTINASNVNGKINIKSSNTAVAKVSESSVWVDNNNVSVTITAISAGSATISLSGEIATQTPGAEEEGTCSRSISVKVTEPASSSSGGTSSGSSSSGSSSSSSGGSTSSSGSTVSSNSNSTTTPTFKSVNQTVYTTGKANLRSSWSTSSSVVASLPAGTELTRIGTSSTKVNGYIWSKVKYNGKTGYIASSLLTTTAPKTNDSAEKKPEENQEPDQPEENLNEEAPVIGLQSLEINGITLSPEFKTDVMEYTATLEDASVSELDVNAVPLDENFKIEIAGNVELKDGENVITILVKDEEADKSVVYQITVTKTAGDTVETDYLEDQDLQAAQLEAKQQEANKKKIIIGVIAGVVLLGIIILIIVYLKRRNKVNYDDTYGDYDIDLRKNGKH